MQRIRKAARAIALATVMISASLGVQSTASSAGAAPELVNSCLGSQVKVPSWSRTSGGDWQTPIYKTTSRCFDINFRTNLPANSFRVHWVDHGTYGPWRHPASLNINVWQIQARDVRDNSRFRIEVTGEVIQANNPSNLGSLWLAF